MHFRKTIIHKKRMASKEFMKFVINADDFGYCDERNRGIIDCFLHKKSITSASLLVNGQAAESAVAQAKKYNLPLGLHMNVTEGKPICPATLQTSLTDDTGSFHDKMSFITLLESGSINMPDLKREMVAQIELFIKLTGVCPVHVDGHQHVHILPGVNQVFAEAVTSYGVNYTRLPYEIGLHDCDWFVSPSCLAFNEACIENAAASRKIFNQFKLRHAEYFTGLMTLGSCMTVGRLQKKLNDIVSMATKNFASCDKNQVTCELMVHPGYPAISSDAGCGDGPDTFAMSVEREHEMRILRSDDMFEFYDNNGIILCSFTDFS
ncbi:carbohydrate deacetylase-like [Tubulanus polymorphus]|uniref:carbohydrate deacetylase-like n=1 Tax=Tubulanus polymorphus TaxID=672921 RepID=UPI003DA33F46